MSLRKDQKKRLQPILTLIKGCLQQSNREIINQQHINQGIVEQLLQTDLISTIHSSSSLRLVIYQLILFISQQATPNTNSLYDNPVSFNRISNLLFSIKEFLKDFTVQNEETPIRNIQKRYSKQSLPTERTSRNRKRIFFSYYSQYCSLLNQIDNYEECSTQSNHSKVSSDEALIDQLENLVFKKQSIIQSLQGQIEQYKHNMMELEKDLTVAKLQHQEFLQEKLVLEEERDQLKTQLLEIVKHHSQTNKEQQSLLIDAEKYIWNDGEKTISNLNLKSQIDNEDLMKCLISQALIIQALIQ